MGVEDDNDFWTQLHTAQETPSAPNLTVQTMEGVQPLGCQFGIAEPESVPAELHKLVFGPLLREGAEDTQNHFKHVQESPLHTYAIVDAAKVIGLSDMLDASGLEHRCLFKGDAYDQMKDVAPWIVRLEDGNAFTRNLFTRSSAPCHLWDNEPGVLLRSSATLDAMWTHFRKFVRVQSESGTWRYQRVWEPRIFGEYFSRIENHESVSKLFFINNHGITLIYIQSSGRVDTISVATESKSRLDFKIDANLLANISAHNQLREVCETHDLDYLREDYRGIDFAHYTKEDITIVGLMRAHFSLNVANYNPRGYAPEVARQKRLELIYKLLFSKKQGVPLGL